MEVNPEGLAAYLAKGIPSVISVFGREPLLLGESVDLARKMAREAGYDERIVFDADATFDWGQLHRAAQSMSLFVQRRLIEIRLPEAKPGRNGGDALCAYLKALPSDTVLLLVADGRFDKKARWCQALARAGILVNVWPVTADCLPQWVARRMRAAGLKASAAACQLLSERVEGNLLACAQEIKKLALLKEDATISHKDILAFVSDNARYDIFVFVDAALAGDVTRLPRILHGLRQEGVPVLLLSWAMQREIRTMISMRQSMRQGLNADQVMQRYRIWPKERVVSVRRGLLRHADARWLRFLCDLASADRMVKGVEQGNAWDKLLQLAVAMAGVSIEPTVSGK